MDRNGRRSACSEARAMAFFPKLSDELIHEMKDRESAYWRAVTRLPRGRPPPDIELLVFRMLRNVDK